jgi:hypothetical protein
MIATIKSFKELLKLNALVVCNGVDAIDYGLLIAIRAYCRHHHSKNVDTDANSLLDKIAMASDDVSGIIEDGFYLSSKTVASLLNDLHDLLSELTDALQR